MRTCNHRTAQSLPLLNFQTLRPQRYKDRDVWRPWKNERIEVVYWTWNGRNYVRKTVEAEVDLPHLHPRKIQSVSHILSTDAYPVSAIAPEDRSRALWQQAQETEDWPTKLEMQRQAVQMCGSVIESGFKDEVAKLDRDIKKLKQAATQPGLQAAAEKELSAARSRRENKSDEILELLAAIERGSAAVDLALASNDEKYSALAMRAWARARIVEFEPDYQHDIRLLFDTSCSKCHNGSDRERVNLMDYSQLSDSGQVVSGDLANSMLWAYVNHEVQQYMPKDSPKLSDDELFVIRLWIDSGLKEKTSRDVAIKCGVTPTTKALRNPR